MNAERVIASYRRACDRHLEVRRYTGAGTARPQITAAVMGFVNNYQPHELVAGSGIQQGDRKAIVVVQDLIEKQFPLPLRRADKLLLDGREVNIEAVDDESRRIGDTLVAYELQIRG